MARWEGAIYRPSSRPLAGNFPEPPSLWLNHPRQEHVALHLSPLLLRPAAVAALVALACPGAAVAEASPNAAEDALPPGEADPGALAKSEGPVATFVGFRRLGPSRALVYVELTEAPDVELQKTSRTVNYTMRGTRVTLKNNRNPLLAGHFESVVQSAHLEPAGKDLKLVIQLRKPAEPQSTVVRHGQGATLKVELQATDSTEGRSSAFGG